MFLKFPFKSSHSGEAHVIVKRLGLGSPCTFPKIDLNIGKMRKNLCFLQLNEFLRMTQSVLPMSVMPYYITSCIS